MRKDKKEGDGASPIGIFPLRKLYYRADKLAKPNTKLPAHIIKADDGWCDDLSHADYNKPVKLPFAASHEKMWRDDDVYDLVVEIGYNDAPIEKGKGSAIFMHIAKPDYTPTEGCVALKKEDLLELLSLISSQTDIEFRAGE